MRIILISLGMLVLHGTAHAASPLASCSTPPTLATPYNDLRLASDPRPPGHPVPLPIQVASTLLRAQADFLRRSDPALFADVTCAQMSKPTYRITLDNGTHIYVADLESNFGGFFLVAAFNPRTVQATADPWVVSNRFFGSIRDKDGYLNPPLVSGLDIHRNGHLDLVFEEQVHNGDVYNGQLYRYFDFGPKMELKPVLSLESQVECWDFRVKRKLTILGTNRIEIQTWQGADTAQPIWKNAGSTLISANSLDGIFHIVERRPNAVKLPAIGYIAKSKMLLTTCDPNASDDDRWISRGLEYYY